MDAAVCETRTFAIAARNGAFVVAVLLWLIGSAYAQVPTDYAAFWALDDGSGTTATDRSTNGNNGTLSNNGPVWTTGDIAGALGFDGVDDNVQVSNPSSALKPMGAFAISAWVKYTATDTSGGEIASMGDSYALRVQPDGNLKAFFYNGTTWNTLLTTGVNTKDGAWHHLAAQYDGTNLQLYVDGTSKGQQAYAGQSIAYTLGTSFVIGQHGNGDTAHNFNGTIDQVRVYSRGLTSAEITALAAEGAAAIWTLDEGSGSIAGDSTAHSNNGTLGVSGPTWTTGHVNSALQFDGVDDNVQVFNPSSALKPMGAFAISAWVKYTATDTSGGEVASMGDSYALRVQPDGNLKAFFYNGTTWNTLLTTGVNTKDGAWHHLAAQYDGTNLQLYVDGTSKGQQAYAGQSIAYTLGTSFVIGQHGNGDAAHNFNGTIDEVRVYGRALAATEIAALATQGAGSSSNTTITVFEWNVRKCRSTDTPQGGTRDCTKVAASIHTAAPDVALLGAVLNSTDAETIRSTLDTLDGVPPGTWHKYFNIASGGTEGQVILTRLPLTGGTSSTVTSSDCPGAAESQIIIRAQITVGSTPVNFFVIDQQDGSSNSSIRACQAARFRDWANNNFGEPRIIAGDFNGDPSDSGITTYLSPGAPSGYVDGWASVPSANKSGYPDEGSSIGNSSSDSIFGRTRRSRIDYIIISKGATGVMATQGKMWDMRISGTTCNDVDTSDGYLGSVCSGSCSSCTYVDDKGVRPTDHIPTMLWVSIGL